ncbi:MAG: LPS export ABC transporter periplasmic protein LptC [Calditrichia bacterium]
MKIINCFKNILFILMSVLVFLTACTDIDNEGKSGTAPEKNYPDQESWNSTITITKEGKRLAEVWAGYMALYNKQNMAVLQDSVHVDFYNSEGQHNSVLTADSGRVNNSTNNLYAMGNVVVVSDSGIVLQTEKLQWDNQRQKIVSDVPVQFTTEEDTLYGDSFISDPNLKNYEIRNTRGKSRRKIPLEQ